MHFMKHFFLLKCFNIYKYKTIYNTNSCFSNFYNKKNGYFLNLKEFFYIYLNIKTYNDIKNFVFLQAIINQTLLIKNIYLAL
ncbi:hypothetical protein M951_chr1143 (nucleomorph) [Lotharella oceanica]|uniref:Uncharacterized protein n=1 Tax=Lotharella oceanica TaxID=641309 RepID=A0A060DA83_9EUKA|nr:hypothetical protein M951_chr1143 [Lotharella oceanica]